MSVNWITDRAPTKNDTSRNLDFYVWTLRNNEVTMWYFGDIEYREPWMPIEPPEPYVKPKRWVVREYLQTGNFYVVERNTFEDPRSHAVPTREAAERIAAIYEEVMP